MRELTGEGKVYVTDFKEVSQIGFVNDVCRYEDELFISTRKNEEKKDGIYTYHLENGNVKRLPVDLYEEPEVYIGNLCTDSKGNLWITEGVVSEDGEKTEKIFLTCFAQGDGSVLYRIDISEKLKEDGRITVRSLATDKNDNVYVLTGKTIWIFDKTGEEKGAITGNTPEILCMGKSKEGEIVFVEQGVGENSCIITIIAPDSGKSSVYNLQQEIKDPYRCGLAEGSGSGVFLNTGQAVVAYDIEQKVSTEYFKWSDSRIQSGKVCFFTALEDGRFVAVLTYQGAESVDSQVVYLTETEAAGDNGKTMLTLGINMYDTIWIDRIQMDIDRFNQSNTEYEIRLINYGTKKDEELSREDFFTSVLDCYTYNGELYSIPYNFGLDTLSVLTEKVNGAKGQTMEELIAYLESLPEGSVFSLGDPADRILIHLIQGYYEELINWETGECSFNSDLFISMLETAQRFGDASVSRELPDDWMYIMRTNAGYWRAELNSGWDYIMYRALWGEPVTFIGYPNPLGENGTLIKGRGGDYVILSNCIDPDGAWEFIRNSLTPEGYDFHMSEEFATIDGWPSSIDAFEKKMELEMQVKYVEDEDGNLVEEVEVIRYPNGFEYCVGALKPEERDEIRALIESVGMRSVPYMNTLNDIIYEESAAYFAGDKTAGEVAKIIQSRVQIYVDENR